jgi:SAM-dependent methyltransferase
MIKCSTTKCASVIGLPPRERRPAPMNPNKALWEKGDFTRIAATMRESGAALVNGFGITKSLRILDLGCGDGTTALPAAALGADVLGVDIAENLVEAGNRRASEQGLSNCTFQEGDATDLQHLEDRSFDLVVRHCQTNLSGPAKGAGLKRLGRQLTPLRECGSAVLFEDVAAVEVAVMIEVVVD